MEGLLVDAEMRLASEIFLLKCQMKFSRNLWMFPEHVFYALFFPKFKFHKISQNSGIKVSEILKNFLPLITQDFLKKILLTRIIFIWKERNVMQMKFFQNFPVGRFLYHGLPVLL